MWLDGARWSYLWNIKMSVWLFGELAGQGITAATLISSIDYYIQNMNNQFHKSPLWVSSSSVEAAEECDTNSETSRLSEQGGILPGGPPCLACCSSTSWQHGRHPQFSGVGASHRQCWWHRMYHCGLLRSCHRRNETVGQCLRSYCFSLISWAMVWTPEKGRMKVQREQAGLAREPHGLSLTLSVTQAITSDRVPYWFLYEGLSVGTFRWVDTSSEICQE